MYEAGLSVCASDIDAYLRTNVLAPCGMASSAYVWNDAVERHGARPHDASGKPLALARTTATDAARYAAMGGLRTTAMEYANFLLAIIAPKAGESFGLTAASRQQMLRPHVKLDDAKSWGLGWEIRHTPRGNLIQHQGGQAGVQAFTAASVERQSGYVILTNSANGWKVFSNDRFTAAADRLLLG
jgi:CubicO group peptidase (beta-lactamase class C family)